MEIKGIGVRVNLHYSAPERTAIHGAGACSQLSRESEAGHAHVCEPDQQEAARECNASYAW